MFKPLSDFILAPAGTAPRGTRLDYVRQVGAKACGLALIPSQWTPPFVVVSTDLYKRWCVVPESDRRALLEEQADILEREALKWTEEWPSGLTFRSSADTETIRDRGAYETVEITADYSINRMCGAIERVFQSFNKERTGSAIAIIVQARVANQISGHLSNERRVSQSINFWMCEIEAPSEGELRFNSQRSKPPASDTPLEWRGPASIDNLRELLRSIGRWCTQLEHGRAHIEWGAAGKGFWLFHLDFEDDQPDLGIDPRHLIRPSDIRPSGAPTTASPFRKANFEGDTGWPKIDKVRDLLIGRSEPFPALWYATGTDLLKARTEGRHIADDIEQISHGGAVCRTECVASNIDRLNLPRTDTVSGEEASTFIFKTLEGLGKKGARPDEVCFVLHKFIPAGAAAWALAYPNRQIVLVDALWGLPDGLQYLSHDTFEYDTKRGQVSSERLRYKPLILQETSAGTWQLVAVARKLARNRCLSSKDILEIAEHTHSIAHRLQKPIQIMWFCSVEPRAGVGHNVPWFMMDAPEQSARLGTPLAPGLPRYPVHKPSDLLQLPFGNAILELQPHAELFRDQDFIMEVADAAIRNNLPVRINGSVLGHAFYTLERRGAHVVGSELGRTRTRQKQVFLKLVRDDIPAHIVGKGERVATARIAKSESRPALISKLLEEAQELMGAATPADVTAELADLVEVLRALSAATGVDWQEVQAVAEAKRNSRGSFERNVVLLETSWPAWIDRPRESPDETIALRKLGQITHDGARHTVNFSAVMSGGGDVILRDGTHLVISLSPKGIVVTEHLSPDAPSAQLSFDFSAMGSTRM